MTIKTLAAIMIVSTIIFSAVVILSCAIFINSLIFGCVTLLISDSLGCGNPLMFTVANIFGASPAMTAITACALLVRGGALMPDIGLALAVDGASANT